MLRFCAETAASALCAALALVTAMWPQWIEIVTGLDPDGGDGTAEWGIVALLAILTVTAALAARRDYRLLKQAS